MELKKIFLIILFLIIIFFFYLQFSYKKTDVESEILKLNPDEITLNAIRLQNCSELIKNKEYWIVKKCKDDVYFKLFLKDNGYYMGYCTSWQTPREAFKKLSFLFGRSCRNETMEDFEIKINSTEIKIYNVCGLKVYFRDECILGVGG